MTKFFQPMKESQLQIEKDEKVKLDLTPINLKFQNFTLYETSQMFYLIASDHSNKAYSIIKINRSKPEEVIKKTIKKASWTYLLTLPSTIVDKCLMLYFHYTQSKEPPSNKLEHLVF
jgi:hypothetical protein